MTSKSVFQKVKLSQIGPNPFRRLDLYPLDKAKVAVLKSSMDRTDFWSNVVARECDGKFQLAYGHHRIQAARESLGKGAEVSLIVRDLDDETMLKMMAADNSDAYNMSPGFILETVDAARKFVGKRDPVATGSKGNRQIHKQLHKMVAKFLDWPPDRVKQALAQLVAIDAEDLSRQAVEALPTQKAAAALHRAVREAKEEGKPIPARAQVAIAKRAAEAAEVTDISAPEAIKLEVFERKCPIGSDGRFEDLRVFLGKTGSRLYSISHDLGKILEVKTDINSPLYRNTMERNHLMTTSRKVVGQLGELLKEEEQHAEQK